VSLNYDHIAAIGAGVVLGPIFGSFVTALTYRMPRGESIANGRSRCPACDHALAAPDLVPIVSWTLNRGRCRYCKAAVSPRYPTIEVMSLFCFVTTAIAINDPVRLALAFFFIPLALALAIIDFEHQRLPNVLVALVLPFAIAWRWWTGHDVGAGLLAAAVTYACLMGLEQLIIWRTGESGLGGGDAKLIAFAALCLPLLPFFVFLGVAGATGIGLGVWWQRRTGQKRFPFGINILLAWWLCLVVPLAEFAAGG
jgi:leader peptidase (prepilin peptidase)/N-methyltransferase